jgi:hypothetical protein
MFLLLAVPLNGWSIPLTKPDLDRQGQAGDCEKEIEDYLEGLRPVIVDCLEDATAVDEERSAWTYSSNEKSKSRRHYSLP